MNRGEVWTVAGAAGYGCKPRPAVIVQDERFDANDSITVCGFTTERDEAPFFRILVIPTAGNGLDHPSRIMVDKLNSVPRAKLGVRIGRLSDEDLIELNRALLVFLGLASTTFHVPGDR